MTKRAKQTISFLIFVFTILIGFNTVVFADASSGELKTEVRGYVDSDTTWTASKSPYYITGKITVAEGAILTIEPGVTVYFADEYYPCDLSVYGNLVMKGTTDNKITLQYATDKVTGGIVFNNINGQTIENIDCKVPITLNGSNTTIQNSNIGSMYITGDGNKLLNLKTYNDTTYLSSSAYRGFTLKGNKNEILNCKLNIYGDGIYTFINGDYNSIMKSTLKFYANETYNQGYIYGYPHIKGNYNNIIQNTFYSPTYNFTLYLEQNNNSFHHNNLNDTAVIVQKDGLTNLKANNYNTTYYNPKGETTNSIPVYAPVSNNLIDITKDLTFDEAGPILKAYTPSKTQVGINEDVALSVRLTDDSNIFGVFWVKDQTSGFFKNNQFTYDDKTDTYSIAMHYDAAGVNKLPLLALVDDYNNITYVDVATYQSGKFNNSITVGTAVASNDANLKSISVNGTVIPNFIPSNKTYSLTLPKSTSSDKLDVKEYNDSTASVSVSGDTLVNGSATIKIIVTAQDGITKNTYTVNVTKESDTSTGGTIIKGDVTGDSKVTIMDAVKIAKYIIGSETLTDTQILAADFNGDGKVTIMDAQKIALFVVGK
ncbi:MULTISPECIES: dockerin type I domain-containing protein [Clostridium]|uniref:Dockerin type I domain-containing protein n=1 Tax=Clostridium frigoriphilum TaxID=443253 RepID=A0ABU7UNF3_9CLOT|nr:dockerin type I domain-containing protein [Clostridium sp. DSM 17811]MBU3097669.1 cadherin-like beta sandwich domain-containing protein [Clostridium sp. DSM 17811]